MNQARKLVIISNEKISTFENKYYCDNIDMKSISEGLSKIFKILIIARRSNVERSHQINLEAINIASNIFTYLLSLINTFKNKEIIEKFN